MDEWPKQVKFAINERRVQNQEQVVQIIEQKITRKTHGQWNEILKRAKFPFGPVNLLKQVFQDPQIQHDEMVRIMNHATNNFSTISYQETHSLEQSKRFSSSSSS